MQFQDNRSKSKTPHPFILTLAISFFSDGIQGYYFFLSRLFSSTHGAAASAQQGVLLFLRRMRIQKISQEHLGNAVRLNGGAKFLVQLGKLGTSGKNVL
jgi:hypothetical protein